MVLVSCKSDSHGTRSGGDPLIPQPEEEWLLLFPTEVIRKKNEYSRAP